MQLKYSNYVAFSHDHGFAVNNSSLLYHFSSDSNCKNFIFSYFRKTLCYAQLSRGCQVIATNFFATFSSIFPIKPLFWNRGRYIVVTKSAGRM